MFFVFFFLVQYCNGIQYVFHRNDVQIVIYLYSREFSGRDEYAISETNSNCRRPCRLTGKKVFTSRYMLRLVQPRNRYTVTAVVCTREKFSS